MRSVKNKYVYWMVGVFTVLTASACSGDPGFRFEAETIASDIEGAYLTKIADLNDDGRPDVILLSVRSSEVLWFENPTWTRHVLAADITPASVGAAVDEQDDAHFDGARRDGVKIVLLTGFHRDDYAQNIGALVFSDGASPVTVFAHEPAAHRAAFADIDGDGARELVVAPIAGPGDDAPIASLVATPLVLYRPPQPARHVITDALKGTVHGLSIIDWDGDGRDDILTAGFGGVWLHQSIGKTGGKASGDLSKLEWRSEQLTKGRRDDDPRQRGAGDIKTGMRADGTRFLATIESVHGGDVAVYEISPQGVWRRQVIDQDYRLAHGFAVADFNGDGGDEIIVGESRGAGGVFLYSSSGGGKDWRRITIDKDGMAAGGCEAADMTGDGRVDLVCAGFPTRNAKLYVNMTEVD